MIYHSNADVGVVRPTQLQPTAALMRAWSVLCAILLASSFIGIAHADGDAVTHSNEDKKVTAGVSVSVLGPPQLAAALQHLLMLYLDAGGVTSLAKSRPANCTVADRKTCVDEMLKDIGTQNGSDVALVTIPAEEEPHKIRDLIVNKRVHEYGDLVKNKVYRRACLATRPAPGNYQARSLLDLADPKVAAAYNVPDYLLSSLKSNTSDCPVEKPTLEPPRCQRKTCATIFTSYESEKQVLCKEVEKHHLYAKIVALEDDLYKIDKLLNGVLVDRAVIACDWAPELTSLKKLFNETLGPPPCEEPPCPFESRRLVKYMHTSPYRTIRNVLQTVQNFHFTEALLVDFINISMTKGPEQAAKIYFQNYPYKRAQETVNFAIYLPYQVDRDAYNSYALDVAAILANAHINKEQENEVPLVLYKILTYNDKCESKGVYFNLWDSLSSGDFEQLAMVAGPACGVAWADGARHFAILNLPQVAYTPQVPVPRREEDLRLQLLAAGDARHAASAITALANDLGWRRVAALSEPATRFLLEPISNVVELVVNKEVPEDGFKESAQLIQTWASNAANKSARILYLCVEDTRIARAALCAARSHGLTPTSGAVWLLCNSHKRDWLEARLGENCTTEQLKEEAQGHFTVTADWALEWEQNVKNKRKDWLNDWHDQCMVHYKGVPEMCNEVPGPNAALLYDIVINWYKAIDRLVEKNITAVYDLHRFEHVSSVIKDITSSNYTGITGLFKWKEGKEAYTRNVTFVLSQWDTKLGARSIGNWSGDTFNVDQSALRWYTPDGVMPDDGSVICALQGLASALNADCQIALVALCSLLVTILVTAVSIIVWHCRRRAEKEYRKRLIALGMRTIAIKPHGLDRWEVPRERVVINRKLGTGAFGTVYGGHALLAEDRGWSAVAVKTLKAGATTEEKLDFLSEAEAMKRFDHKNIVRLLGVVTKTEPVCTVMEFMLYGDLKNYLLARRHLAMGGGIDDSEGLEADEASPKRLTGMALDVARALSYLAQLRYIHRDVAARNCLVSARRVVKLADFGMTRLVFENDYYRFSRKGMLPVRWMAPESLALGVFSPASDVWSFGVLLYEIVTFGSLPVQGLSNSEVLTKVKGGNTLELPHGLRPQLEGLIKSCWQQDPKKRPSASEVAAFLADAPRLLSPCLDVPLDALSLDADPPWRLPRDQAEARWVSWAAPASATTDTTYLSTDGPVPLDTDSFLP
ncbi:protein tyrosine kinase domain-containing protein [Phthorimaea operculella]|nr:protein tyrosine kinase domain-containing protein [Phthorimaea operculella]